MPVNLSNQHDELAQQLQGPFLDKLNDPHFTHQPIYVVLHDCLESGNDYLKTCIEAHTTVKDYRVRKITKQFKDELLNHLCNYDVLIYQKDLFAYHKLVTTLTNQLRGQLRDLMLHASENNLRIRFVAIVEVQVVLEMAIADPKPNQMTNDRWVYDVNHLVNTFWQQVIALIQTNYRSHH